MRAAQTAIYAMACVPIARQAIMAATNLVFPIGAEPEVMVILATQIGLSKPIAPCDGYISMDGSRGPIVDNSGISSSQKRTKQPLSKDDCAILVRMTSEQLDTYFEARLAFVDLPHVRIQTWTDNEAVFVYVYEVDLINQKIPYVSYGVTIPELSLANGNIAKWIAEKARKKWNNEVSA